MARQEMTYERAHSMFTYDPSSGWLIWKRRPESHFTTPRVGRAWNTMHAGKRAGSVALNGYRRVNDNGAFYYEHRLIYLMHHGVWPDKIDHQSHERDGNTLDNLLSATSAQNARNASRNKNNKSGVTGVCWIKRNSRWLATIWFNYQRIQIGTFLNFEDAVAARKAAEQRFGYHPNHGQEAINDWSNH